MCIFLLSLTQTLDFLGTKVQNSIIYLFNVCFKINWTNHSSDTVRPKEAHALMTSSFRPHKDLWAGLQDHGTMHEAPCFRVY